VLLGIREDDEHAGEVRAAGIPVWADVRMTAELTTPW
jgi:hypothetical protein